jgi:probable HAF family extracellular repeat protein
MLRNIGSTILLTISLSACAVVAAERQASFTSFDYPGATSTSPNGINADGSVVGNYVDSAGKQHGFLLSGGSFTSIDYPGSMLTGATAINDQGDIVGNHVDVPGQPGGGVHGYLLQQGAFTAVDYPGHLNTVLQGITNGGQILGCYRDNDTGSQHAMILSDGQFSELSTPASTNYGGLPDGSVTIGQYTDMITGATHSFITSAGAFASFDYPFSIATQVISMSPSGEITGIYMDTAKVYHGFVLNLADLAARFGADPKASLAGSFHFDSLEYPGAVVTIARGINCHGDIVGSYFDAAGKNHGFLLSRPRSGGD